MGVFLPGERAVPCVTMSALRLCGGFYSADYTTQSEDDESEDNNEKKAEWE